MSAATPAGDVEAVLARARCQDVHGALWGGTAPPVRDYCRACESWGRTLAAALRVAPQPEAAPQPSGGALTDEPLRWAAGVVGRARVAAHDALLEEADPVAKLHIVVREFGIAHRELVRTARAAQRDPQPSEAAAPCPTCVREGGPYRCCSHCTEDPPAHENGERDLHELPCSTCVQALAAQPSAPVQTAAEVVMS